MNVYDAVLIQDPVTGLWMLFIQEAPDTVGVAIVLPAVPVLK
jgi:hypothetical protein